MSKEIKILIHSSLSNEQAKVMYAVAKLLSELNLLTGDPLDVEIVKADRTVIHPCGKSKDKDSKVLKLNQLEFMEENGEFFFAGPIRLLKMRLNEENKRIPIQVQFI